MYSNSKLQAFNEMVKRVLAAMQRTATSYLLWWLWVSLLLNKYDCNIWHRNKQTNKHPVKQVNVESLFDSELFILARYSKVHTQLKNKDLEIHLRSLSVGEHSGGSGPACFYKCYTRKRTHLFTAEETSFQGDFPVPPPYSVATSLPTYDEAEKAKAAAMAASTVDVMPRRDFSDADQLRVGNDGIFMLAFFMAFLFNWIGFCLSSFDKHHRRTLRSYLRLACPSSSGFSSSGGFVNYLKVRNMSENMASLIEHASSSSTKGLGDAEPMRLSCLLRAVVLLKTDLGRRLWF
ncbi:hypothetical protein INR49_032239 [Caranx melampygus]|nr:hypothetical protein INR49_032239 [Caranx melampygus]